MGRVGCGTTGHTTAKLTVGHNLVYSDLIERYGVEVARLYAESNQAAIELIAGIVDSEAIECDWERASNYVYTENPDRVSDLKRELDSARRAGVEASLTTETELPYPIRAAIGVENQAQFHPRRYLLSLAERVHGGGCSVFEDSRATGVRNGEQCRVELPGGVGIECRHVVVATHLPFLDRGLFFTKAHPEKSYAVAGLIEEASAPRGMYINAEQPTRSVRSTPAGNGARWLIVGGESHKPGQDPDDEHRYQTLAAFARERFGTDPEWQWSAHDYTPLDRLPYIGRLRRGDDRVLTATGFAKWGLTKATTAAQIVTDEIVGRTNPYSELYDARRLHPRQSARSFLQENAHVAAHFVGDRLQPRHRQTEQLQPGQGAVVRAGARHYAVSRDDQGRLHSLSARCTHLGCLVDWNPADRTWECPCHGSTFAADGTLVSGPATRDLPEQPLP
jgi:glycine/D-amino acid oxidase-like deaminating enzyme/nitrite reductase/ring-hydroxylating ferredoxin subunit